MIALIPSFAHYASSPVSVAGIILLCSTIVLARLLKTNKNTNHTVTMNQPTKQSKILVEALVSALPDSIILPANTTAFKHARSQYWDQAEADRVPTCIVQPRNAHDLSVAITIIKSEYDRRAQGHCDGGEDGVSGGDRKLFAIRSGGHSPVAGSASIEGGVLIDLSLLNSVKLSSDSSSVDIGPGCRWGDVSKVLDPKGLAIVGGRNSNVGVGGLFLGGGISFFSPRFGLASSNITSYEVILASGSIVSASPTSHPDLYRALKSGHNNFGIVTRFTTRCFPCPGIWSGFLYLPAFQTAKVLTAFHDFLSRKPYDENAAGPLICWTYMQKLGLQAITMNLVYTKIAETEKGWPKCFATSGFKSLFRLWSTCKAQSVTSANDEMHGLDLLQRRDAAGTTTITNDKDTIAETHASYREGMEIVKDVQGIYWTLVLQPLLPFWTRGDGGGHPISTDERAEAPLVLVSYTVSWDRAEDDELVERTTRQCIERIEAFAASRNTGHPYRFPNYCGEWQNPFHHRSEGALRILRETSRVYDPDGLFQRGCSGPFKLGMGEEGNEKAG